MSKKRRITVQSVPAPVDNINGQERQIRMVQREVVDESTATFEVDGWGKARPARTTRTLTYIRLDDGED